MRFLIKTFFTLLALCVVTHAQSTPSMSADDYNQGKLNAMANTDKPPIENEQNSQIVELDIKKDMDKLNEIKQEQMPTQKDVFEDARILEILNKADSKLYKATNTFQAINMYPIEAKKSPTSTTQSQSNAAVIKEIIMVQGICEINYDVSIANDMTREFICKTDKGFTKLNITLKAQNEVYMLIGIPNFLVFDSNMDYKFTENDKTMVVDKVKSIVTNYEGNSNQLATIVDYKKIEKGLNIAQKEYSSAMIRASEETVEQKRAADEEQVQSSDQNGNVSVTTNTKEPDIATNFVYGLVDGTLRVAEKIADLNEDKNPTLYKILKGSKFKITLYGELQ